MGGSLRFAKIAGKPRKLFRMTGLSVEQFETLSERLEPLWKEAQRQRLSRPDRKYAIGGGRKYALPAIEDKLLPILVFYRFYLSDEMLGWVFGLDGSNLCRLRAKMEPVLEKAADPSLAIPLRLKIPKGAKKISTPEELLRVCPDFAEILTDATEQQRQRPAKKTQRKWYSGKKKRHTVKTQLTVNREGRILDISKSFPGHVHDYEIFKTEGTAKKLPAAAGHYVDKGYDGAQKDYPGAHMIVPFKKRRNHRTLTLAEKRFNKKHSRIRILIEHVLSRMKKYQILYQVYRHRIEDYGQRFRNIAALTNFRLATMAV